ncbi:thiol-disulfide oxidoreductase DCC family protein [Streptomyces sp. TLI_171]|uniref:thiol-disulfide oxidoreductase DCC family protein n=1 Tax=Streptomyces sp. TLI_171 TaxID=1938859 RepID=UPI000C1A7394|nr:DCC1-like thiol-disulfide oxidoreductase family protein [Streptomyces sp. TLI_171]RKE20046.1 putative DCC family thiol-disulfide oxidoreductase YuxK [Streptomyces sp. TLI_171]
MSGTADTSEWVLAYDGDCAFCQATIDRIRRRAAPQIDAVPWQALPERLTAPHLPRLDREVLLFHNDTVHASGAHALARFVGSSPARRYQLAAAALSLPGVRTCARQVYALVAKNRQRMPGGTAFCALPRP